MRLIQHIIKNRENLQEMERQLLKIDYKYYLMFDIAVNTGLSIGDILQLTVIDLKDKTHIEIVEHNSNIITTYSINFIVKHEIENFVKLMANDEYLFQVENGGNKRISSFEAYRILNIAAAIVGIEEIEPYTLRKTFGYWNYIQNKDVTSLQKMFHHSEPSITLRYIEFD